MPEAKRQFGYFALPLLKGDHFVGRLDAKADRPRKALIVRAFHVESHHEKEGKKATLWREAQETLAEFARFNGCEAVERGFR